MQRFAGPDESYVEISENVIRLGQDDRVVTIPAYDQDMYVGMPREVAQAVAVVLTGGLAALDDAIAAGTFEYIGDYVH